MQQGGIPTKKFICILYATPLPFRGSRLRDRQHGQKTEYCDERQKQAEQLFPEFYHRWNLPSSDDRVEAEWLTANREIKF